MKPPKKGAVNDIKNKGKDGKTVMDFFTASSEKTQQNR